VLERNRYYWNDAATAIARVEYYPTEDLASELKRYRAGELDVTATIPMAQAAWVRRSLGGELRLAPYLGTYFYGFNLERPPFAGNPALRQALSLAVDRELIASKLLQGAALPAYGLLPPGLPDDPPARPDWADWPQDRRLQRARELYAQAGYSGAHPLQIELRFNTSEDNRRIALLVAAMWKQRLGVQTQLVNEEWKVFLQNRRLHRQTQVFRMSWIGDYADPMAFADILRSGDGRNDESYRSADYDGLLAAAAGAADPAARSAAFAAAERRIAADAPILPLFHYLSKHLVKPRVQGWQDNPLDVHYSKDLRLQMP
jgi:oligopeptide transport system substrate-binding protein